jgi:heme/copper-type cytochrome/quinol oxidase subunit 2
MKYSIALISHPIRYILAILAGLVFIMVPIPTATGTPQSKTVRVEASSYQFDPGVVRVNRGDRVTLELVSTDVVHGLHIDGYNMELSADPGQLRSITFTADRSGSFRMRCSVSCGALHPFMIGKLVVGNNQLLWRGIGLAGLSVLAGLFFLTNNKFKT